MILAIVWCRLVDARMPQTDVTESMCKYDDWCMQALAIVAYSLPMSLGRLAQSTSDLT